MSSEFDLLVKFVNWLRAKKSAILYQQHECTPEHLEKFILNEWKICPDKEMLEISPSFVALVNQFLSENPDKIPGINSENESLRSEIEFLGQMLTSKLRHTNINVSRDIPKADVPREISYDTNRYILYKQKSCFDSFQAHTNTVTMLFNDVGGGRHHDFWGDGALCRERNLYLICYIKMFPLDRYLSPDDHAVLSQGSCAIQTISSERITLFENPIRSILYNEIQYAGLGWKITPIENMCIAGGRSIDVRINHKVLSHKYEMVVEFTGFEYERR